MKDFLALRSTVLDYHLTMALLKLNLKPDLDLRKTLQDAKYAEAGLYIAPEVSKEAVLEVVTAPASAATAAAVYSAMPAPEQLARVNSVEVKQKQPIQGTMLSRAESAGPGVLKKEVSGVKRQNTWSNFAPSKDADTASVSSALSESKSEYGAYRFILFTELFFIFT